jgi:putative transposase
VCDPLVVMLSVVSLTICDGIWPLTGIRARVRLRKPQRATVYSWAFAQLGGFLSHKAQATGVAFVEIDPAYTSQTCHGCGWVNKRNRRSQSEFECGRCGLVGHADHNAAINIATRGVERWGEVMRPHAAPTLTARWDGSSKPNGRLEIARDAEQARPPGRGS